MSLNLFKLTHCCKGLTRGFGHIIRMDIDYKHVIIHKGIGIHIHYVLVYDCEQQIRYMRKVVIAHRSNYWTVKLLYLNEIRWGKNIFSSLRLQLLHMMSLSVCFGI